MHLSIGSDAVVIRVASESGSLMPTFSTTLKPGQAALGHPYEWWVALGNGKHEIKTDA
ncbi:MAG: hypothetical protein KGL39_52550 [Patescibacteria group bacterium]|nr:hypothetical protein [Patescibacteria group bacterium]